MESGGLFGPEGQRPTESLQGGFSLSLSRQVSDREGRSQREGGPHCPNVTQRVDRRWGEKKELVQNGTNSEMK